MAGRIFFLLCSLGLAIATEAQNCTRPVLGPNLTLKSSFILLNEFQDGQKINLACEIGYDVAGGSTAITCNAGSWTDVTLVCELHDCGPAEDPEKGEVRYPEGTKFGATAVVFCMPGHRLVGRSDKIRCGTQDWMGRIPECEVQKCDPPASIANGQYSPVKDIYEYRDVVQIQCNGGLYLIGAKSLMCSENGSFTPSPPTCKDVNCEEPDIPYSEWVSGARVTYKYKSTVTYKCITGYEEIGSKTSVCESDGKWVPKLLDCKPKNCFAPSGTNMHLGDKDGPSEIFPHGTVVTFICDDDFVSDGGSADSTCTLGNWSPVSLRCKTKSCSAPSGTNMRLRDEDGPSEIFPDGTVVTFICNDGFESDGGLADSTCTLGNWSPVTLKCKIKTSSTKPPKTTPDGEGKDGGGKDGSGSNAGKIIGGLVAAAVVALVIGCVIYRQKNKKSKQEGFQEVQKTQDEEDAKL